MEIEDIIEALNRHIECKRKEENIQTSGHLVLQKILETNSTFKAYKTYKTIIWFIKGKARYKVLEVSNTQKTLEGLTGALEKETNQELCYNIFNWIDSKFYEHVIKGEYKGYKL